MNTNEKSVERRQEEGEHHVNNEEMAGWTGSLEGAKQATQYEHSLSLWSAMKTYPRAIGWSIAVSMAIVMEGYDTGLMGSFFGFPAFQQKVRRS